VESNVRFNRSRSFFSVEYGSDPDKVALVDTHVLDNIRAMQRTLVSDDELTNARQYQIRSIPLEVASIDRIAHSLLTWSYEGEPLDQPMVAAGYYLNLTAHQVQEAFKQYLHPQHLVQIVQGLTPSKH